MRSRTSSTIHSNLHLRAKNLLLSQIVQKKELAYHVNKWYITDERYSINSATWVSLETASMISVVTYSYTTNYGYT